MKRIIALVLSFVAVGAAMAGDPGYSINKHSLRITGYFDYPAKVVADVVQKILVEDGMQPESHGKHSFHIIAGDIPGPNVTPKNPDFTTNTTKLRYAVFVTPFNERSSAQVAMSIMSPSAVIGEARSYEVASDHPDVVLGLEKNLLERVAKRLEAADANQPK